MTSLQNLCSHAELHELVGETDEEESICVMRPGTKSSSVLQTITKLRSSSIEDIIYAVAVYLILLVSYASIYQVITGHGI